MSATPYPVRRTMCATCPWRADSPYAYLKESLSEASKREGRVCHSTGTSAIHPEGTGIEPHICAGSRAEQLHTMTAMGVLRAPTHEAWNEACRRFGLPERVVRDPEDIDQKETFDRPDIVT